MPRTKSRWSSEKGETQIFLVGFEKPTVDDKSQKLTKSGAVMCPYCLEGFLSRLLAVLSQGYWWVEMGINGSVKKKKCLHRFANSCSTHSWAPQKKCSRHLFHGWRWQLGSGALTFRLELELCPSGTRVQFLRKARNVPNSSARSRDRETSFSHRP